MKRKFTIIVIGNRRRICSIEMSMALVFTVLSVIIGLVSILTTLLIIGRSPGGDITTKTPSIDAKMMAATHKLEDSSERYNHQEDKGMTPADALQRKLTVEDFSASYDPVKKSVRYRFLLKNHSEESSISGYIFIIIKPELPSSEPWLVIPKTILNDGKPKNFKDGEPFSISKYKIISKHISVQNLYNSIWIYVFSGNGSFILEEHFSIKNP